MDFATTRLDAGGRSPLRLLVVIALLAVTAAAGLLLIAGSHQPQRVPPPFGLADNGKIVYGANGDLYSRDTLTGEATLLVGGDGIQSGALFSRDGLLVAYDNMVSGIDHVTVANADGSHARIILDEPFIAGSADWSPDGRSMAIVTPGDTSSMVLFIAPADGSGATEVPLSGIRPRDAVWNPAGDGTLLLRGDDKAGITHLYLVDVGGHVPRQYDLPGTMVYGGDWELAGQTFSPDGRTIAHNSVEDGPNGVRFLTYLVGIDGTNQRMLPTPVGAPGNYSQAWPVYSPDGKWIAMESWVGAAGGPATNQVAVVPADGSSPARGVGPKLDSQSLLKSWSPDGKTLLVTSRDRNQAYQVDPATGGWSALPWSSDMPDWQRVAP